MMSGCKGSLQFLSKNGVLVSLFRQVIHDQKFQGRWILDSELLDAIMLYFQADTTLFSCEASDLNAAIKKDRVKAAGDFWKEHSQPNQFNFCGPSHSIEE